MLQNILDSPHLVSDGELNLGPRSPLALEANSFDVTLGQRQIQTSFLRGRETGCGHPKLHNQPRCLPSQNTAFVCLPVAPFVCGSIYKNPMRHELGTPPSRKSFPNICWHLDHGGPVRAFGGVFGSSMPEGAPLAPQDLSHASRPVVRSIEFLFPLNLYSHSC